MKLLLFSIIDLKTDLDYVIKTAGELEAQFSEHIDSGLLEIIAPPVSYYPNSTTIRQTLGDSLERVHWRSKQNLDFAYLMMYSQPKGTYYVQLEDDILTKPSYLSKMKEFAIKSSMQRKEWLILDFCVLGFIGY
jgi:alpha-1,3-mannosylglycoprotein beta-1,4-N-acetylglucosaminyltransferase A/B